MTKRPAVRLRDSVAALSAIEDATDRAIAAGEMTEAAREATVEIAQIRQGAVRAMRAEGMSYREIGDKLGVHFTRVKQLETGALTGRRKKASSENPEEASAE